MKAKLSYFSERSPIITEELTFLLSKLTFLKISKNMTICKKNTQISTFDNKNIHIEVIKTHANPDFLKVYPIIFHINQN